MTTEQEIPTLVSPEMEESRGVWGKDRVSYPVSPADIRKWAIASYWPEKPPRIFWDEDYAKTTTWGGIIAPTDFNPFAWPIDRPPRVEGGSRQPGTRSMNGGQVETFGAVMRPGDVITARSRLKGWNERETKLGLTMFSETETEWRNQNGKHVKTRISTGMRH